MLLGTRASRSYPISPLLSDCWRLSSARHQSVRSSVISAVTASSFGKDALTLELVEVLRYANICAATSGSRRNRARSGFVIIVTWYLLYRAQARSASMIGGLLSAGAMAYFAYRSRDLT